MRYSPPSDFWTLIQKQETTQTINYNFLLVRGNLKDITNRSNSITVATVYCGMVQFL